MPAARIANAAPLSGHTRPGPIPVPSVGEDDPIATADMVRDSGDVAADHRTIAVRIRRVLAK